MRILSLAVVLLMHLSCVQENKTNVKNAKQEDSVSANQIEKNQDNSSIPKRESNDSLSLDYYLENSLDYMPYTNLSFSLNEVVNKMHDNNFKTHLISKFKNPTKELNYLQNYDIVGNEIEFFKSKVEELHESDKNKSLILTSLVKHPIKKFNSNDYSHLFKMLSKADGGEHWEIANLLFTLVILNGGEVLDINKNDGQVVDGYNEWVNNLAKYCFVAHGSNNVPVLIIERKRDFLLQKIDKNRYPTFIKALTIAKIRVID